MIIKLQCMNEQVAEAGHQQWPTKTIRLGSALLCIRLLPYDLGALQQLLGAYTVELSGSDRQLVDELMNWT